MIALISQGIGFDSNIVVHTAGEQGSSLCRVS